MSQPKDVQAEKLQQIADGLAAEIEPPYSECRLTVAELRRRVAEIRAVANELGLRAGGGGTPNA